jgi:hypothetical protein
MSDKPTKKQQDISYKQRGVPLLIQMLLVAATTSYLISSIFSPRFYEHLSLGNYVNTQGSLANSFIWGSGSAWIHGTWLFDLLLSMSEQFFGETSFIIIKLLLYFAVGMSLSFLFSGLAKDRFFGTAISLMIVCGALLRMPLSSELFGLALLSAELALLNSLLSSYNKIERLQLRNIIGLVALLLVHANSDSSSVLALALCLLFLATSNGIPKNLKTKLMALLCLTAIATPFLGMQVAQHLRLAGAMFSLELFYQASPATIYHFPFAFLLLVLILIGVFWHKCPHGLKGHEISLLTGFAALSMAIDHLLPLTLILSGYMISLLWGRAKTENISLGNLGEAFLRLQKGLSSLAPVGIIWVLLCLLVVNVVNIVKVPKVLTLLPQWEVDYYLNENLEAPLYHDYEVGSYLMQRFADAKGLPRQKVINSYASRYLDPKLAAAQIAIKRSGAGYKVLFKKVSPNSALISTFDPMFSILNSDPNWERMRVPAPEKPAANSGQLRKPFGWALFRRIS